MSVLDNLYIHFCDEGVSADILDCEACAVNVPETKKTTACQESCKDLLSQLRFGAARPGVRTVSGLLLALPGSKCW